MRITEIQTQVGRGEYQVDHRAVADAILRRLLGSPVRSGPAGAFDEPPNDQG